MTRTGIPHIDSYLESLEGVAGTLWSLSKIYGDSKDGYEPPDEDAGRMFKMLACAVDDVIDGLDGAVRKLNEPGEDKEGRAS